MIPPGSGHNAHAGFANADQSDIGGDGADDACDPDRDGDGVENTVDLWPDDFTRALDDAGDDVDNYADNCASVVNADQSDADLDNVGDACGATQNGDSDGDRIDNLADNCPTTFNPSQADSDWDGIGDACDPTPKPALPTFTYSVTSPYIGQQDQEGKRVCGVQVTVTNVFQRFSIGLTYSNDQFVAYPVTDYDGYFSTTIGGASALPYGESVTSASAGGPGTALRQGQLYTELFVGVTQAARRERLRCSEYGGKVRTATRNRILATSFGPIGYG